MKFSQLLQILWGRRSIVLGAIAAVTVATLLYNLLTPRSYVAELSLLVEVKTNADVLNGSHSAPQLDSGYLATQVDVIASHNVAAKVVDRLKLGDDPTLQEDFRASGPEQGVIRDWLADKLLDKLTVKPSRDSGVINLNYTSIDPRMSADVANAFADAYIATNLELRMDPARHEAGWFDEQTLGLRKKWEAAQQRLSTYQQENNVVGNDGRLDIENAQMTEIARQLVTAQSAMYDAEARRKPSDKSQSLEQMPDVLGDSLLQNMKAELSRAESKLAEVGKLYGVNYPQYLAAVAQVESLRQKLANEMGTVNKSLAQSADIAQRRTLQLEQALINQRNHILALKQKYDALEVLTREVQGAQQTYESALQRSGEVRLESQLNQSSIAVLNRAVIPRKASRSLLKKSLLAIILGGLFGACAALATELADKRVRGESDITEGADLIMLGEVRMHEQQSLPRKWRYVWRLPRVRPALVRQPE